MNTHRPRLALAITILVASASCARTTTNGTTPSSQPVVGPANGTVMVVGGGAVGPEVVARFIAAAGGPDALIIDVPTAGGDSTYPATWRGADFLKAGGARNIVILHTIDKKVANSDQFADPLARAGGVWFEGGRQWHLVDSYAGTKTEQGFNSVLARGGVVGGSSAGASILSSYMLRGARSGNEIIMAPGYEVGFGYLRGVAIDQHVVARERLRDLADSLMPKHPELLGISEDEGTAWVIKGDLADIIGRNKAFVYGGRDATDARKPFLTLYPGDRYDLGARRVVHRASDESPMTGALLDSIFGNASGMATVLVARDGKVLIDRSYGVPDDPKYMPGTTVPNFPLRGLSAPINTLVAQLAVADGKLAAFDVTTMPVPAQVAKSVGATYAQYVTRRIFTPIGSHKTVVDSTGAFSSNVDELYRLELGLEHPRAFALPGAANPSRDESLGWNIDNSRGTRQLGSFGTTSGMRNAFIRIPAKRISIIILSNRDDLNARAAAERIADHFTSPE
jgi:cyanophycinase